MNSECGRNRELLLRAVLQIAMSLVACHFIFESLIISSFFLSFSASTGTFFLLYDFIDYFQREASSPITREKFKEMVNAIFKNFSQLEKDAVVYQVGRVDAQDSAVISYYIIYFLFNSIRIGKM